MGMTGGGKQGSRATLSEINVTPLVDVMLVLLIIFMVTAPMMQQGLDIKIPETRSTGVETSDDPFVLNISRDSKIKAGNATIPMAELQKKIKAIFATRKNKQIYVKADKRVEYGVVAEALGEIRAAGINNISLITLPKTL